MQIVEIKVESREETGKGPNYRLRTAGRLPAVIYGTGAETQKVSLDYHEFQNIMRRPDAAKAIFSIKVNGTQANAVIRELQRDPVTRRFLHVDLFRVAMDVENTFEVAIHSTGTAVGVREGGILETHLRTVQVRCTPTNLPTALNIDITDLKINATVHASELVLPDGVTLVTLPEEVLFKVSLPQSGATTAAEGADKAAAPEVIGKKKAEA